MQQIFKRLRGRLVSKHWHYITVNLTLNCHSSFVHGPLATLQTFRGHARIVLTANAPYTAPSPREFRYYTVRVFRVFILCCLPL